MREQRGRLVAGVLMVLGALVGSGSVWLHWRTCTGPQVAEDDAGVAADGGPVFGDACLRAMDNGFSFLWPDGKDPFRAESVFGLVFALLLGLSWAVVVATSRWTGATRWVTALPLVLVLAVVVLDVLPRSDALDSAFAHVLLATSLGVLLALIVLVQGLDDGWAMLEVALALCGPAAVGFFANWADYAFMTAVSEASWDTPPWTGAPTLVLTALAGVALVVVARRRRSPRADATA